MEIQSIGSSLLYTHRSIQNKTDELAGQIATGRRMVNSGIDPSGIAISDNAKAQLRGIAASIHNAQDSISLINTADAAMENVSDMVMRIRDLSLRMANEATANTKSSGDPNKILLSDQRKMYDEIGSIATEIRRVLGGLVIPEAPFVIDKSAVTYNGKDLFFDEFDTGEFSQIGPDNTVNHTFSVVIPSMTDIADTIPVPPVPLPGNLSASDFRDFGQLQVEAMDQDLEKINDTREILGAQSMMMNHILNDLNQRLVSQGKTESDLSDIDIGKATMELKKNLSLQTSLGAAMIEFRDMQASQLEFLNVLPTYQE